MLFSFFAMPKIDIAKKNGWEGGSLPAINARDYLNHDEIATPVCGLVRNDTDITNIL